MNLKPFNQASVLPNFWFKQWQHLKPKKSQTSVKPSVEPVVLAARASDLQTLFKE
jgi:hypothetical protein